MATSQDPDPGLRINDIVVVRTSVSDPKAREFAVRMRRRNMPISIIAAMLGADQGAVSRALKQADKDSGRQGSLF